MSKPIDQEREAFETWFAREVAVKVSCGNPDILRRQYWPVWQARAAVQPAGVAVPDENDCVIGGYAFLAIRKEGELHVTVDPTERLAKARADHWREKGFVCGVKPIKIPVSMLAAPHPVSGEQKPERNETNDQIASVLLQHGTPSQQVDALAYAGITAPPAAQGVSGLVEAMRNVEQTSSSTRLRRIAREALAAQAQGGDA